MERDPLWPICQSCARPLIHMEDFGTNTDGTRNDDYCSTCFRKGEFTQPDLTVEEMIQTVAEQISARIGMPHPRAEAIAREAIPALKRWKGMTAA
jgi:hypothetical protein